MSECGVATRERPAAVAGLFYPSAPEELRLDVRRCLDRPEVPGPRPKALVVPHAGLKYSGAIAAAAYAQLRPWAASISRVVLLGPAHRVAFSGLALPQASVFRTPLGVVPVDGPGCAALADEPQILISDGAHAAEHSLEVQLPFLQSLLGEFTLVPLLAGDVRASPVALALDRVWGGSETLIVVSTDLSHFHDDRVARDLDATSCGNILALRPRLTAEDACGYAGVNGFLCSAREHKLWGRELARGNSAAASGDPERVVGYAAFAFYEPDTPST